MGDPPGADVLPLWVAEMDVPLAAPIAEVDRCAIRGRIAAADRVLSVYQDHGNACSNDHWNEVV